MLVDLPIKGFLDETASKSPAPGGGSVSALAGALGAALAVMVANLTADAEGTAAAVILQIHREGMKLLASLQDRIDEDTMAFNAVMDAFKLPKTTVEEKAVRSRGIQDAMKGAASMPMDTAELCLLVMSLACQALRNGNPAAASDAAAAGRIAYAGMWGAVYNVRINIASVKDDPFNQAMRERISSVLAKGEQLLAELTNLADSKIQP